LGPSVNEIRPFDAARVVLEHGINAGAEIVSADFTDRPGTELHRRGGGFQDASGTSMPVPGFPADYGVTADGRNNRFVRSLPVLPHDPSRGRVRPGAVARNIVSQRLKAAIFLPRQSACGSLQRSRQTLQISVIWQASAPTLGTRLASWPLSGKWSSCCPRIRMASSRRFGGDGSTDDRSAPWPIPQPQRSRN
jgi:hypothetical protein